MKCPQCGTKSSLIETRPNSKGVRRRRQCPHCDYRFKTQEVDIAYWQIFSIPLGAIGAELKAKGEVLLTEYFNVQTVLKSVDCLDVESLPSDLARRYQEAKSDFLRTASTQSNTAFLLNFRGSEYSVRCCDDFEYLQVDHLINLEVPNGK